VSKVVPDRSKVAFIISTLLKTREDSLLVIVNLSSKDSTFPSEALAAIDSGLGRLGLRRQVRSTVVPGKAYAVTYEGPTAEKKQVEDVVASVAEQHHITYTVEFEESVSFP